MSSGDICFNLWSFKWAYYAFSFFVMFKTVDSVLNKEATYMQITHVRQRFRLHIALNIWFLMLSGRGDMLKQQPAVKKILCF